MSAEARRILDSLLECYLVGALDAEARAEVEAALAESEVDRARFEELRAESEAFLIQHPPGPLVERFEASQQEESGPEEKDTADRSQFLEAIFRHQGTEGIVLAPPGTEVMRTAQASTLLEKWFAPQEVTGEMVMPSAWRTLLTQRQAQVVDRVLKGWDNKLIAEDLGCTVATVKKHLQRIFDKLGVSSQASLLTLAANAYQQGEFRPKRKSLSVVPRAISLPGNIREQKPLKPGLVTSLGARRILDPLLECYLVGSLDAEARAEVQAVLAQSVADQIRLAELRAESEAFLVQHPPESLVERFADSHLKPRLVLDDSEEEFGGLAAAHGDRIDMDNGDRMEHVAMSADTAEMEDVLHRAWESGRGPWPHLNLRADVFVRYLTQRLPEKSVDVPLEQVLDRLILTDLYLACACVHKVPGAIEALERHYLEKLPASLGFLKLSAATLDEVCQMVRIHLLVGMAGSGPQLGEYKGMGTLPSWMRVIAARMAYKQGAPARETPTENVLAVIESLPVPGSDVELELIKRRYRPQFRQAVREAFATLSSEQRQLLWFHFIDRMPTTKMGPLVGVDQSTVSRKIKSARHTVYEETKRLLQERLGLSSHEFKSLLKVIDSQLDSQLDLRLSEDLKEEEG
jgi:RNA polymerase sigma-70 factor